MKKSSIIKALFKPDQPKPATQMDRTTAVSRDIVDTATHLRSEKTARLRALRLGHEAPDAPAAKTPPPKRTS